MDWNSTLFAQFVNLCFFLLFVYAIVYLLFIRPKKWAQVNAQREDEIIKRLDRLIELEEKQLQRTEESYTNR